MTKLFFAIALIPLFVLTAFASDSVKDRAKEAGCRLDQQDDEICVYPRKKVKGYKASEMITGFLRGEEIWEGDNQCQVEWTHDEDGGLSLLEFRNQETNHVTNRFYFAPELLYKYQKIDVAFASESEFFLKHRFRVSGKSNKKYLIIFHEDGDSGFSISFEVNKKAMSLKEFCDRGF